MSDIQDKYISAVEDLIKDPDSYSTWASEEEESTEIRSMIEENIWGEE